MSHWVSVKLKVTDKDILAAALKRMGADQVNMTKKTIKQYGTEEEAELWVDNGVGFQKQSDGTYSMIGDFYHSKSFRRFYSRIEDFQKELTVAYAIEDQKVKLDEMGFEITENEEAEVGADGLIRMVASRY